MKKTLKNFIFIISILILTCQSAFCYVLTSSQLNQILTNKLQTEAIKKLNLNQNNEELKIKISNIPFESVATKTQNPKIELVAISSIQPNTLRRIVIKNPDNTIVKSFNVNVQTSLYKDVLVANKDIQFNSQITADNAKIEKRDILKYYNKTISNFDNDLIAKRNYQKGSIILADYTKTKSQISRNSIVDIVFLSNGIKIKLQGKALKDGNIGDVILVRSEKYNKIYSAKISSSNEVVVKI